MSLDRNVITEIIRKMTSPRDIRSLSKAYSKSVLRNTIKNTAAKRVVAIRLSQMYRRRKQALLDWARKFNQTNLDRLLRNNGNEYTRRINSIPNPPRTRTNLIKAVAARYILNAQVMHWNNAAHAVRTVHNMYRRATPGQIQGRIQNGPLIGFLMGLPTENLKHLDDILPFYA